MVSALVVSVKNGVVEVAAAEVPTKRYHIGRGTEYPCLDSYIDNAFYVDLFTDVSRTGEHSAYDVYYRQSNVGFATVVVLIRRSLDTNFLLPVSAYDRQQYADILSRWVICKCNRRRD